MGKYSYGISESSINADHSQDSHAISNDYYLTGLSLDGQISTQEKSKFKHESWTRVIDVDVDAPLQM